MFFASECVPFMSLPNFLTLFRIFVIPFLVLSFYLPTPNKYLYSAAIFAIAALTDALDGWLARNLGVMSKFGEFLDPVADKLLVAVTLVLLVSKLDYLAIPAAIIVGREIIVSALREWMAELGKRASVAVSFVGKLKTAIQMLALFCLLAVHPVNLTQQKWMVVVTMIGYVSLYVAAFLTLWSMVVYLRMAWSSLTAGLSTQ